MAVVEFRESFNVANGAWRNLVAADFVNAICYPLNVTTTNGSQTYAGSGTLRYSW
jgi:hypothetical protein